MLNVKKRTRNAPPWHKTGNKKSMYRKNFWSFFLDTWHYIFLCFFVFFSFRCLSYIFYSLFVPLRTRLMKKWLILTLAKIFYCQNVKWFFCMKDYTSKVFLVLCKLWKISFSVAFFGAKTSILKKIRFLGLG